MGSGMPVPNARWPDQRHGGNAIGPGVAEGKGLAVAEGSGWCWEVKGRSGRYGAVSLPLREVCGRRGCTPAAERVLRYVIAHSFSDNGTVRPFVQRQRTIAERLEYTRETVCRAFQELARLGLLAIGRRRRRANVIDLARSIRDLIGRAHKGSKALGLKSYLARQRFGLGPKPALRFEPRRVEPEPPRVDISRERREEIKRQFWTGTRMNVRATGGQ